MCFVVCVGLDSGFVNSVVIRQTLTMEFQDESFLAENEHPEKLGAAPEVDFRCNRTSGIVDEVVDSTSSSSPVLSLVDDGKISQNGLERSSSCFAGRFVGETLENEDSTSTDGLRVENDEEVSASCSSKQGDARECQEWLSENEVKKSSLEVKNDNHGFQENKDPLFEVVFELDIVKEALAKELLMLREMSKNAEDSLSELHSHFSHHSSPAQIQHSIVESTYVQKKDKGIGVESDDLFTKKMVTAATVRSLSFTSSSEEKARMPSHGNDLADTENKHKEVELILGNNEVKAVTVWKHASYFIIQLLLLLLFIGVLISQSLSNNRNTVPT